MIRWTVPAEAGNRSVTNGTMQTTIESMMGKLKPEAAHFFASGGKRSSLIPQIAEPLFQASNADVEFLPVMDQRI